MQNMTNIFGELAENELYAVLAPAQDKKTGFFYVPATDREGNPFHILRSRVCFSEQIPLLRNPEAVKVNKEARDFMPLALAVNEAAEKVFRPFLSGLDKSAEVDTGKPVTVSYPKTAKIDLIRWQLANLIKLTFDFSDIPEAEFREYEEKKTGVQAQLDRLEELTKNMTEAEKASVLVNRRIVYPEGGLYHPKFFHVTSVTWENKGIFKVSPRHPVTQWYPGQYGSKHKSGESKSRTHKSGSFHGTSIAEKLKAANDS